MMIGSVVKSLQSWYRNIPVCTRKQTFTTVTCLLVLTVGFTYFGFNHHRLSIRLVPDKQLHKPAQYLHRFSKPLNRSSPTRSTLTVQNTGTGKAQQYSVSSNVTYTERRSTASYDRVVKGDISRDYVPSVLKVPPEGVQRGDIPDRNSIKGSLNREPNHVYVEAEDEEYYIQDNIRYDSKEETIKDSSLNEYSDYADYITNVQVKPSGSIPLSHNSYTTSVQSAGTKDQFLIRPKTGDTNNNDNSVSKNLYQSSATTEQPLSTHTDYTKTGKDKVPVKSYTLPVTNQSFLEPFDYDNQSDDSSWQVTRNSWTKMTTEKEEIFYDPQEVDLMSTKPIQFLKDYRNPCWVENVTSWYIDNVYLEVQNVRAVLTRMSAILKLRQEHGNNHRIRCLPYFLIIGQPKCGSTDLYEKLMAHPDAIRPPTKEPHWWTRTRLGRHRAYGHIVTMSDYVDLFDYAAYNIEQHPRVSGEGSVFHRMITGEGSMSTFWDNDHWWAMVGNENSSEPRVLNSDYVHHLLPEAKLILILRNPTTRMYSDYLYFRKEDKAPEDFHNDVVNAIGVYENCSRQVSQRSCVYNSTINSMAKIRLRVGMYVIFMRDWLRVFPMEQFFIVRTEVYASNPRGVLRELYKFLGLEELSEKHQDKILSRKKANTRRKKDKLLGDMLPETRTLLNDFYRPLNQELATLLNDDQFLWGETGNT